MKPVTFGFAIALLVGPLFGLSLASANTAPAVSIDALAPGAEHRRATRVIVDLLRRFHYRKVSLDDALSEQIFDRYFESLDPNRSFFLAADIAEFSRYRSRLDDSLRYGHLEPAFEIFKRMRQRSEDRIAYAQSLLESEKFDFTRDESYRFDREDAPWAKTVDELNELWRKRVKSDVLDLMLNGKEPSEIKDVLRKRYERLGRRIDQLQANDVFQYFINAYTVSIEPHTAYFSPRASENFRIRMSLSLEGIGAALQTENDNTVVRRIIKGGPADLSGQLKIEDRIVGVAQGEEAETVDVVGWRLEDVVDLIRGPKGSVVRLSVLRKGTPPGSPADSIMLTREKIKLEERAAQKSILDATKPGDAKIGVIELPTFYLDTAGRARGDANYRSTTRDVRRLANELKAEGVDGIVIDLRGNSGGSLVEATELTGIFIDSGPVVQIRDSTGRIQINEDKDAGVAYDGPLAVLVDRRSASASEIFAGAIQDYRRGLIIGEPTFGKGTVQNLFDLDRRGGLGQLKVTIAQFFRVSGDGTQHRGVVPDIIFPTADSIEDEGERSLENALPWAAVAPANFNPSPTVRYSLNDLRDNHLVRVDGNEAFNALLGEANERRDTRQLHSVSLVERVRKKEFEERTKRREDRVKALRVAQGLPAVAPEDEDPNDAPDILLEEAAAIMRDYIGPSARAAMNTTN
ncbi:MAG: carboxy terminal-processing peptidase [Gammaproteobacteria bacterium]|nr:carboxy terminal-processing peptidase [Gammaproteobacteria bacterium]